MRRMLHVILITAFGTLAHSQSDVLAAIRAGELQQVRNLITEPPAVAEQAEYLVAAVGSGEPMVSLLIELGFDVNAQTTDVLGATAIMYAAYNNDVASMKRLFDAGADLDFPDTIGDPAINWATYGGRLEAVRWLLDHRVRIDQVGHGNATQIAKRRGFPAIIDALCAYKACNEDSESANSKVDALASSIDAGDLRSFRSHYAQGAARWLDHTGRPLLHRAARQGRNDMLAIMLDDGADVDLRDDIGFTPLMEAARDGRTATVDQLLAAGARADSQAMESALRLTPVHLAAIGGNPAIVRKVAGAGANLNAQDTDGSTPLLWALFEQNTDAIDTLLELGADPGIENQYGYSAAQLLDRD